MAAERPDPFAPPPGSDGGDGGHARDHDGEAPRDDRYSRPPDPAALFTMLDGMRRMAPRELEDQLTNLIREFLLTLRSLIDWYLERLDRPRQEPKIEDIPID
jgi:hypothetical protein